ncbi:hypothetical protein ACFYKX_10145 [Cytobacillus sp. FJAT-54145]|uniref:Lipoprotein n=1 Tax=Cytobacillus spartinae TaxID=3299023 RepID=A0ABW6K9V8_9BACI
MIERRKRMKTRMLGTAAGLFAASLLLGGCEDALRYGEQINSQNVLDASRQNDAIVADIVKNGNAIQALLFTSDANTFNRTKLDGLLTSEMDRTQEAILKLENYRQPDSLQDETLQTFNALVNYKSALMFLREKFKSGESYAEEEKQYIAALAELTAAHYSKP